MAQLAHNRVFKKEVLSKKDFSDKYANGVSSSALDYAIENGHVDWIQLGRDKFIVLTEHTKQYSPNAHPARVKEG